MDNTSQLKLAGTSMLSHLVLPDHCSQFSNMIRSSSNCMDIRQKNKINQNYQARSWITQLLRFQPIESCDEPSMSATLLTRLYAHSRHLAWLRRSSTTPAWSFSTDWIPWSSVICLKNLLPRSQCPQCYKQSKPLESNYIKFYFFPLHQQIKKCYLDSVHDLQRQ